MSCKHEDKKGNSLIITFGERNENVGCRRCFKSWFPETKKCEEKCHCFDQGLTNVHPCPCHQKEENFIVCNGKHHGFCNPCCSVSASGENCTCNVRGCSCVGKEPCSCHKAPKPECGGQHLNGICLNKVTYNPIEEPAKYAELCNFWTGRLRVNGLPWFGTSKCGLCKLCKHRDYYTKSEIDNLIIDAKIQTKKVMWDEEKEFRRELLDLLHSGKCMSNQRKDIVEDLRKRFLDPTAGTDTI